MLNTRKPSQYKEPCFEKKTICKYASYFKTFLLKTDGGLTHEVVQTQEFIEFF